MDSELRILIFLIRATGMSKKKSGGAQKKKSKINHSLVQIKNPHFLHFQMAISVVDINLLLCVKQKFHGACLGVSLLLCLMCLKLRGFQIDNCVFQRDLNSENLKYQVVLPIIAYCQVEFTKWRLLCWSPVLSIWNTLTNIQSTL